mmetsp:Transcript_6870/g.10049  ORF Transcript_6870/g.10049 Transcript_6870/m.10049 type:complete len:143 (+) Transcript_6870:28-456(+)
MGKRSVAKQISRALLLRKKKIVQKTNKIEKSISSCCNSYAGEDAVATFKRAEDKGAVLYNARQEYQKMVAAAIPFAIAQFKAEYNSGRKILLNSHPLDISVLDYFNWILLAIAGYFIFWLGTVIGRRRIIGYEYEEMMYEEM